MKFRVLRGNHAEGSYPEGHPWAQRAIVYERGEIVDSKTNLARFNVPGPLGPKFQRIYDSQARPTDKLQQAIDIATKQEAARVYDDGNGPHGPNEEPRQEQPPLPSDGLDTMTVAELRELASEEEVELSSNATKAQIIDSIRKVYA